MKRVMCALIALAMVLALPACKKDEGGAKTQVKEDTPESLVDYCLEVPKDYMKAENDTLKLTGTDKELKDYSANIKLPKLANAKVKVMMSIDWKYLQTNNNESTPFQQYHATLMWRNVYADQKGDVEIVKLAESEQTDTLVAATATGTAPDIIPANYDLTYPRWNAAGLTASLTPYKDYLGLDKQFNGDYLYNQEFLKKYFQWGGEPHAATPLEELDRQYIVYNKTMFDDKMEKTPMEHWKEGTWTWTNFVEAASNLTDAENNIYGFSGWGLFPYFAPYPMIKVDEKTGLAALNIKDEKFMAYMTEVYDFYQNVGAAKLDLNTLQGWAATFPRGGVAMVMTTRSQYRLLSEKAKVYGSGTLGIAPVPAFDKGKTAEQTGIPNATLWAYSIAKGAKNPNGAATYIHLETMVLRNVNEALKGKTWEDLNLTQDEKDMIKKVNEEPVCMEVLRGTGNCYTIVDSQLVPEFYYNQAEKDVAAIFDSYQAVLQAEVDDYNNDVKNSK